MKKSEEEDDENVMLIRHVQKKTPALFDYVICIKDFIIILLWFKLAMDMLMY